MFRRGLRTRDLTTTSPLKRHSNLRRRPLDMELFRRHDHTGPDQQARLENVPDLHGAGVQFRAGHLLLLP